MNADFEKGVEELKRHIMNEYSLLPEFIEGFTSIYEETEDYTCLTLKKLMGKRERGKPVTALFSQDEGKTRAEDRSSCQSG